MRAKFGVLQQTHGIRLRAKIRLYRFILSPSGDEQPQFLPFFGLRHLVVSTVGGNLRKLNTDVQLQTFRYPAALKLFLCSNAFLAKSWTQTLTFTVHKRDEQTNRHADKQTKNSTFLAAPAAGEILAPPNLAW